MDELKSSDKPFDISKAEVWQAWEKVKDNKGAPGVDGCSIADFEDGTVQLYDVRSDHITQAELWSFERGSRPAQ